MQEEIFLQCTKVYIWHGSQSGSYFSVDSHQTRHLKKWECKYSVVHSVSAIFIRKLKFEKGHQWQREVNVSDNFHDSL